MKENNSAKQKYSIVFRAVCFCFALFLFTACQAQTAPLEEIAWEEIDVSGTANAKDAPAEPTAQEVGNIVYAKSPVVLRAVPSYDGAALGVLDSGDNAIRIETGSNGWDMVLFQNQAGFINQSYLTDQSGECAKKGLVTASLISEEEYPDGWLEAFNAKIIELQTEYPNGFYWNHRGIEPGSAEVTNAPCQHSIYGEFYCNKNDVKTAHFLGFSYGTQCTGFSGMLSDSVFGKDAPIKSFKSYDDIKIGDEARINADSHTVFILDKTDEYVIVAECNADYQTCRIDWGRKIPRYRLRGVYLTRWE